MGIFRSGYNGSASAFNQRRHVGLFDLVHGAVNDYRRVFSSNNEDPIPTYTSTRAEHYPRYLSCQFQIMASRMAYSTRIDLAQSGH